MQVWLLDDDLMLKMHNEHRLVRTTKFMYWGTKTPPAERQAFTPPTAAILELVRKAVDEWCVENHRGENTVIITLHKLDGEWWFLIQHGGTMSRLAEAKGDQKTETLFYRPGKDDVAVYNVERDEIRIHTGSKAEWELYRKEFGQRLRGDPEYFSERKNFVLDPLRKDVGKALDPDGIADIKSIKLQELELVFGGDFDDRIIRKSDDIFYPPLKVLIGSVTTSAAIAIGGLALMVLPTLIVGNELLILDGVVLAVGGWFLAHRHGRLQGFVDANKNGVDDRLEKVAEPR